MKFDGFTSVVCRSIFAGLDREKLGEIVRETVLFCRLWVNFLRASNLVIASVLIALGLIHKRKNLGEKENVFSDSWNCGA